MHLPGKEIPWKQFFTDLKNEYKKDNITDAAGSLTYFAVLALFPFLLFLVSLASVIIDPAQAEKLVQEVGKIAPKEAIGIISERLRSLGQDQNVGLLSVGALLALWAASNGVAAAMRALNITYDVKEGRPFWKVRGTALLFTIGGGVLALAATAAIVAVPKIADAIGGPVGTAIMWLRIPVAALLMMLVWAVAYYLLPDVKQKFKFITPGSVFGVLIWLLASAGFSFYVSNFGKYDATYGSIGGVIVMLLWMWISSQVFLLGAEINSIIEHRSPDGKEPGEKIPEEDKGHGLALPWKKREAKEAARARGPAWGPDFSPSQHTASARGLSEREWELRNRQLAARRQSGPMKKLGMALWGAVVGAALIRLRRSS